MEIKIDGLENFGKGLDMQESKKSIEKAEFEFFQNTIENLSLLFQRSQSVMNIGIDISEYENDFYLLIESLISKQFGGIQAEIILWWVYDMPNLDKSTPIYIVDQNDNKTQIKTIKQLYNYIKKLPKK